MWFKNLCLYQFESAFPLDAEALADKLAAFAFRPCGKLDLEAAGWASPLGDAHEPLVYAAGGYLMICLKEENKLLPASVIKEVLDERVGELQDKEARKIRKREKDRLKDEIVIDLLPRAFSRTRRTYAYIDTREGWMVVDAGTWNKAEDLTERLRDALGSLPITPPQLETAPQAVMTRWLATGQMPPDFSLGEECVLVDPELEGGEVRCKRQDLTANEVRNHISAGKRVGRLALNWQDRMSFLLDADSSVKRLRFNDVIAEDNGDLEAESDLERFDSDFSVMTLELARLIPRLMEVLGPEAETKPV